MVGQIFIAQQARSKSDFCALRERQGCSAALVPIEAAMHGHGVVFVHAIIMVAVSVVP